MRIINLNQWAPLHTSTFKCLTTEYQVLICLHVILWGLIDDIHVRASIHFQDEIQGHHLISHVAYMYSLSLFIHYRFPARYYFQGKIP